MIMKIIEVMIVVAIKVTMVNLEVDGSVPVLVKDPEQLVQVLLSSRSLLVISH